MQQSSATPKNRDVGIGLQKIITCSQSSSQCLLVSIVFGTVSSLHPTSFYTCFTNFLAFDTMRAARHPKSKSQKFIDTAQCEHEYTNTQLISIKLAKVTQNTEMELL